MPNPVWFAGRKGPARRGSFTSLVVLGSAAGFGLVVFGANLGGTVGGAWNNIVQAIGKPAAPPDVAGSIVGRASIIDGDTIDIGGTRIRLHGIDAPEGSQTCQDRRGAQYPCGQEATRELTGMIRGKTVNCDVLDRDQYGRSVSACSVGSVDINASLVSSGWALAYRQYSTAYVDEELAAKVSGSGMWQGKFMPPWDWRVTQRSPLPTSAKRSADSDAGDCRIKGNINSRGERIFHMPGQRDYSVTQISMARGERWFCSVSEAVVAGWRASRV